MLRRNRARSKVVRVEYPRTRVPCPCGKTATGSAVHEIKDGKPLCMQWKRGKVRIFKGSGPVTCRKCIKLAHINAGLWMGPVGGQRKGRRGGRR